MKKMLLIMMALVGGMTAGAQEVGEISDSVKAGLHSDNVKDAVNTVKGAFEEKVVEAAKLVDQLMFEGILTEPHASLCHFLHFLDGEFAAIGHTFPEKFVTTVNVGVQIAHLLIADRT